MYYYIIQEKGDVEMDVKKCDRCGDVFDIDGYLLINKKYITKVARSIFGNNYDLCEKCKEEFYDFMNKYKEVIKYEKK